MHSGQLEGARGFKSSPLHQPGRPLRQLSETRRKRGSQINLQMLTDERCGSMPNGEMYANCVRCAAMLTPLLLARCFLGGSTHHTRRNRPRYERKLINLVKGEHKSEAYLQINPRGKVPALSIDGQ